MKKLLHLKRVRLLALIPIAFLFSFFGHLFPQFAEGYAETVYPLFSKAVSRAVSVFPFSLAECLVAAAIPAVLLFLAFSVRSVLRHPGERGSYAARAGLNLLCALGILYFAFVFSCGINYSRFPFSQVSGLAVRPSSTAELKALCEELAGSANSLRGDVKTDKNSVMRLSFDSMDSVAREAQSAYDTLEKTYPTLKSGYARPKPVRNSRLMSYCNITGMFFPFTLEANVNVDVPEYTIPATMCHELTHLRGYMREDEANFAAYLACRQSKSADFRYSGTMLAFVSADNALFSADSKAGQAVYDGLNEDVRRDFAANSEYWRQFEGPVADTAEKMNDAYLKSNRQAEGVKSYGKMVDLLLADYRKRHGIS